MQKDLFHQKAARIRYFLTDVDGVMTDGTLSFFTDQTGTAREIKRFESLDGMGLLFLRYCGIHTGIISKGNSPTLEFWAKELGMDILYYNISAKTRALEHLQKTRGITPEEIAFVGDDLIDLGVLKRVGLPLCVANGVEEARQASLYVTARTGGRGAVRELAEKILKARGDWPRVLQDVESGKFQNPQTPLTIIRGL